MHIHDIRIPCAACLDIILSFFLQETLLVHQDLFNNGQLNEIITQLRDSGMTPSEDLCLNK